MIQLFIFLLIALVTIYTSDPERKALVWYYSTVVPVVAIVFYGIIVSDLYNPYSASQEIIGCILPALIAGLVIYNHLNIKVKKGKVSVSPALFAAIAVSLVLGIWNYNLQLSIQDINLKQTEKEISPLERVFAAKESEDKNESKLKRFSFKGLTFSYPDNWEVSKEEIDDGIVYHVNCENKGNNNSEIITFSWTNIEMTKDEMLELFVDLISQEMTHANIIFEPASHTIVRSVLAKSLNYSGKLRRQPFYGKLTAFRINGNSVIIAKQTNVKSRLDGEFKTIEDSFEFLDTLR